MTTVTVAITPPGATSPIVIGTREAKGIVPEGVTCTVDQHGPASCGFTLKRSTGRVWPDIQAGAALEIAVDGMLIWSGRVTAAPSSGADTLTVTGEGWQYHLDDDQQLFGGVTTAVNNVFNQTAADGASSLYVPGGRVDIAHNVLVAVPRAAVLPASGRVGATWDAGEGRVFAGCSLDYTMVNPNVGLELSINAHTLPAQPPGSNSVGSWSNTPMTTPAASGTVTSTFGTAYRYVTLILRAPALFTAANDHSIRINAARFATTSSYLSSGASVLKASTVVATALAAAPLLDQSTVGITATTFNIPDFWPKDYATPRELIDGVNAYHGYEWLVTADRRLLFQPYPSAATLEMGAWSGSPFIDQSHASLTDLANKVVVEYTNANGLDAKTERTMSAGVLTNAGFTRARRLSTGLRLTQAAAEVIGDVWLGQHTKPKLSGSFTAYRGSVRDVDGADVLPWVLMHRVGEVMRVGSPDPVTGERTRDGRVVSVTYNHDTQTCDVALDNDNANLEAFLGRLQVVSGRR